MKKRMFFLLITSSFALVSLASCSSFSDAIAMENYKYNPYSGSTVADEEYVSRYTLMKVYEYHDNRDYDGLKSLFCEEAIEAMGVNYEPFATTFFDTVISDKQEYIYPNSSQNYYDKNYLYRIGGGGTDLKTRISIRSAVYSNKEKCGIWYIWTYNSSDDITDTNVSWYTPLSASAYGPEAIIRNYGFHFGEKD